MILQRFLLSTIFITLLFSCSSSEDYKRSLSSTAEVVATIDGHEFAVEKIDGSENLTPGVQQALYDEQVMHNKALWGSASFSTPMDKRYWPESTPKFKLPYYLIPAEDAEFLQAKGLVDDTMEQISVKKGGKKFFKLFVHPQSYKHYAFLKDIYEFVGPDKTELSAAPTSSYRSLMVWNHQEMKRPFIAKVTLDTTIIGSISRVVKRREVLRSLANQRALAEVGREELRKIGVDFYPESAGLNISKEHKGAPTQLGGQIIRELPDEMIDGEVRWVSLSTVMSSENEATPLIMDMIKKSGMSSYDFYKKFFIDSYMDMFEEFSFKRGFNFEPHSQNLSMELKNGVPTGKWVHRDFGGFWVDIIRLLKSGGPFKAFADPGNAEDFYFLGGRSNFANSYAFFYKRQVFEYVLGVIKNNDPDLTSDEIISLNKEVDERMVGLLQKHLGYSSNKAPTMSTYHRVGDQLKDNIEFKKTKGMKQIKDSEQLSYARNRYGQLKVANDEWVPYAKYGKRASFYYDDKGFYVVEKNKIRAFGLFNHQELDLLEKNGFKFETLIENESVILRNPERFKPGSDRTFMQRCSDFLRRLLGENSILAESQTPSLLLA